MWKQEAGLLLEQILRARAAPAATPGAEAGACMYLEEERAPSRAGFREVERGRGCSSEGHCGSNLPAGGTAPCAYSCHPSLLYSFSSEQMSLQGWPTPLGWLLQTWVKTERTSLPTLCPSCFIQ